MWTSRAGLAIVAAVLLLSVAGQGAEKKLRYLKKDGIKLLSKPNGQTVATLGKNSEVTLSKVEGDWALITVTGWTPRDLLSDKPVQEESKAQDEIPAGKGFYSKNVLFRESGLAGTLRVVGEMINRSGKDYEAVIFKISVYDAQGRLLDASDFAINAFARTETRSFEAYVDADLDAIDKHKIQFDLGA